MILRYSRPRHLMPGWTRPLRPRATKLTGLTTVPSPPLAVSSSHQAAPAAWLSGSVTSTTRRSVRVNHSGSAATSSSQRSRCHPCSRGGQARSRGRADGGVLALDELHRLGRPRQQLAVEHDPARAELVPEARRFDRAANATERRLGIGRSIEEGPTGPCVDRPRPPAVDAGGLRPGRPTGGLTPRDLGCWGRAGSDLCSAGC
jgi:hypothetical protein